MTLTLSQISRLIEIMDNMSGPRTTQDETLYEELIIEHYNRKQKIYGCKKQLQIHIRPDTGGDEES